MKVAARGDTEASMRDKDVRMQLLEAARKGDVERVWLLLAQSDVKADLKDNNGRTSL
jgi:hypothetical protein